MYGYRIMDLSAKIEGNRRRLLRERVLVMLCGISMLANIFAFLFFWGDMGMVDKAVDCVAFAYNSFIFLCAWHNIRWELKLRKELKEDYRLNERDTTYRLKKGDRVVDSWNGGRP